MLYRGANKTGTITVDHAWTIIKETIIYQLSDVNPSVTKVLIMSAIML